MFRLRDSAKNPRPRDRPHCLFIDFKAAYDTVDRQILYRRLVQRKILSPSELRLLEFIHYNLRVSIDGEHMVTTSSGVPQGLISSPLLFNIYVEPLLEELESAGLFSRMYADDAVSVCNGQTEVRRAIAIVERKATELKLRVNKKKSGVLVLYKRPPKWEPGKELLQYPFVQTYKYLGTVIDRGLTPAGHFKKVS